MERPSGFRGVGSGARARPGATSYLIQTSEGSILYTGDFRFHGTYGHLSEVMVDAACDADIEAV
ncbi:unnamed protein product, partial [marine sediment metagenome]